MQEAREAKRIVEAAHEYKKRGWAPVPVEDSGKRPLVTDWPNRKIADIDPQKEFSDDCNVGIVLGENSGGLVDVDLDCEEAIIIADLFLPKTGMIFGREGAPRSHRLYKVDACGQTVKFSGVDNDGMLVEYRASGAQTVFPPSTHESGEPIAFETKGGPAVVSRSDLLEAIGNTIEH